MSHTPTSHLSRLSSLSVALVCALASGMAFTSPAQAADVTVYGRIDTGLQVTRGHTQHQTKTEMRSGFTGASRFGFRIHEVINPDWQVKAVLESGINSDDGTLTSDDVLFSRQSTLALISPTWGTFAMGRSGKVLSGANEFTRIGRFTPFTVVWGDASLMFYGKGARISNGLFYQSPTVNGFTAVMSASLQSSGEEVSPFNENTRYWGASVDYTTPTWGALMGFEQNVLAHTERRAGKDNPTALQAMGYVTLPTARSIRLYAAYQYGDHLDRLSALKSFNDANGRKLAVSDVTAHNVMVGAKVGVAAGTLRLSALYSKNTNGQTFKKLDTDRADYWALGMGYEYPFSKRTMVYGAVTHLVGEKALKDAVSKTEGDLHRTSFTVGLQHKF